MENAKEEILSRLRKAEKFEIPQRIELPPPYESAFTREELIEKFASKLEEQTGVFYRTADLYGVLEILGEISAAENLKNLIASEDHIIKALNLSAWAKEQRVNVVFPHQFDDREAYKNSVFTAANAGITGADFAIAESGTIAIIHDSLNARLLSLAPILHIAVLPADKLVPVYESAIEIIYKRDHIPSHVTFITGPSMTADIQGQMFKGMHGPRKLMVIVVE